MKQKLKLFVWTGFSSDWTETNGLAFAIAETEEEARNLVIKEQGGTPDDWGSLEVRPLNKKFATCVSGGG